MGLQALDKFAEIIGFRLTYQFMDKAGESYDILQFSAPFFLSTIQIKTHVFCS